MHASASFGGLVLAGEWTTRYSELADGPQVCFCRGSAERVWLKPAVTCNDDLAFLTAARSNPPVLRVTLSIGT